MMKEKITHIFDSIEMIHKEGGKILVVMVEVEILLIYSILK